ncbi:hypothetical protein AB0L56_29515 [Streptomyces sp. NPDC052079]|uniref:hypothetical protein n=1 Tax=Streptomyces sp. NPDC052079 TaxID=3155526 RepID=UPI003426CFA2
MDRDDDLIPVDLDGQTVRAGRRVSHGVAHQLGYDQHSVVQVAEGNVAGAGQVAGGVFAEAAPR